MASTIFDDFIQGGTGARTVLEAEPQEAPTPATLGEIFGAGVQSGAEGMSADISYFKALTNTLTGDQEEAENAVREARIMEQLSAEPLDGLETFEEFVENPTFSGFVAQATKGTGQVVPSAITSITGYGVGALAGRALLQGASKKAANRVVEDAMKRSISGSASEAEKQLADEIYDLAYKRARSKAATAGGFVGAAGAEYVPLSGGNLNEALDSGKDLDTAQATRAALVAVPQAAIGAGSELAIYSLIGKVAKTRATKEGSYFGRLAKELSATSLKSGGIESGTEVVQEGISSLNRADLDPTFTKEDAQLRLGEAAFVGFFGGAAAGAGGAGVAKGIEVAPKVADAALDTAANVTAKARDLMDKAQGKRVDDEITREQYGDVMSGETTPESKADINAQLKAMANSSSSKQAVWVAGEPQYGARENKPTEIVVDGQPAFAAHIPGRGTIVSTSKKIVREVIASRASDTVLASALGYSATKSAADANAVVQVVDKDGGVVSEEATNTKDGLPEAVEAAEKLSPEGGSVRVLSLEKALELRKKRFEAERGPEVTPRDDDPDAFEEADPNETPTFGSEFEELGALREEMQNSQEVEGEVEEVGRYESKTDSSQVFENEESARDAYVGEFGETDFAQLEGVTAAALNAAARESKANPNAVVELVKEGNQFVVRKTSYDKLYSDGPGRRYTLPQFIEAQAKRAAKAKRNNQSIIIERPDGTKTKASLVSLTNAGRRLVETREGSRFEGEQGRADMLKQGLAEILADLAVEGYDVTDLGGVSLLKQDNYTNGKFNGMNMVAGQLGKTEYRLNFLQSKRFVETSSEFDGDGLERKYGEGDFDDEGSSLLNDRPDPNRLSRGGAPSNLGPAPADPPAPPDPTQFDDPIVRDSIDQLIESLKMKDAPRVFNFDRLSGLSDTQLREAVGEADFPTVKRLLQHMQENDQRAGSYFRGIAMVRDATNNPLSTLMTAAHEIGHHLYQTEQQAALENNALRPRLLKAFEKHPQYKRYVELYGDAKGFEEWYADQVSRWATKQYINRSAKTMTDRHFKNLAQRLKRLWRAMVQGFRVRKGPKAPEFEQYIEQVVESRKEATRDSIGFKEKAMVAEVREAVIKQGGEALAKHWKRNLGKGGKYLMSFVATADGVLRLHAGDKIADMFYVRSQDAKGGGRLGMLKDAALKKSELIDEFTRRVGRLDDPDVQDALTEAADDAVDTADLVNPKAKAVRQFFDSVYDTYIEPSNSDIGRRKNYSPVSLDLLEIAQRPDEFKSLILAANPGISPARAEQAIHKLRQYAHSIQGEQVVLPDDADPARGAEASRLLTDNVELKDLMAAGFALPPHDALVSYISHLTKRVEFNRATNNGAALREELDKLSPEDREKTMQVINTYLGYQGNPISPLWRQVNSWAQLTVFTALLPFATIGSLPELAGPIINSKEFNLDTFQRAFKEIAANIKDRKEARRFAQDIGVVQNEAAANAWVTQSEQDYMTGETRQLTDTFFRAIGLDFFTKFSREFAAGMGRQFILKHALEPNERSTRYLAELGLTAAEVKAWKNGGGKLSTPEGQKVKKAIQRFVESSILRPNAAERPIWASDPRWALVWQLKSYFYAYSKVIGGGVMREGRSRAKEGQGGIEEASATLAIFALTAVATMPLAMLGMELREYAKNSLAWLLPGFESGDKYFRSDRMDWDEYLFEVVDKSGFLGPLSLGFMAQQSAQYGNSPSASLLGPTAETIDEAVQNGWRIDKTLKNRIFPLTVQL